MAPGRDNGQQKVKRIGILIVHGIGEQKQFEHLEAIASNLYRALNKDPNRKPHIQVRHGDQLLRHSSEHTWREAPVRVRWQAGSGDGIEVSLRETHWADLDLPMTWSRWFHLVGWALSVSGVQPFTRSNVESSAMPGMTFPAQLSFWKLIPVRLKLFAVSLLFLLTLSSVDLLYALLVRFSFRAQFLKKIRGTLYDYLGDVKLYQDWFERKDETIEAVGDLSRVAIRRRMVRTLIQAAAEVERGALDGYFVFAHSLGTVVAFNALMEHALTLPNYLTEDEWSALPSSFKKQHTSPVPGEQMPRRPPWLGPTDAIDRDRLFSGLRGFLTWGSPLDKFAALWPAIVPVNLQPIPGNVPWINVADTRDLVAGSLDLFPFDNGSPPRVGGLHLNNVVWADQTTPISAHTRYWTSEPARDRLIDRLVPWLEGGQFVPPEDDASLCRTIGFAIFCVAVIAILATILGLEATGMIWIFELGRHPGSIGRWMGIVLLANALVVLLCSLFRRVWEWKALRLPS